MGYWARRTSHSVHVVRDPLWVLISVSQLTALPFWLVGLLDVPELAVLMAFCFDAGYVMGYTLSRPGDVTKVITYTDEFPAGFTEPLVFYSRRAGVLGQRLRGGSEPAMFWQPQSLIKIVKSFLGFRDPLDYDMTVARYFKTGHTNGLITLTDSAVTMAVSETAEQRKGLVCIGREKSGQQDAQGRPVPGAKKYLFHGTVLSLRLVPSSTATEDRATYLKKAGAYIDAVAEAARLRAENAQLKVQLVAARYDAAGRLVSDMYASDLDEEAMAQIIDEKVEAERKRRGTAAADAGGGQEQNDVDKQQ